MLPIDPGFDLFETQPGTTFGGVPFEGDPFNNFDFGAGPVSIGNTDTIVQRLGLATAPGTTIPVELIALHLMSSVPADFGLGLGTYFITLQSERGGPASPGQMTIFFGPEAPAGLPHGTYNSFFDVFFDIRLGSLNGPIAVSANEPFAANGVPWNHFPPPGAVEITGVNTFLNGSDRLADFFPLGPFAEVFPGGTHVEATATGPTAAVPEPSTLVASLFGALALLGYEWKRRARQSSGKSIAAR